MPGQRLARLQNKATDQQIVALCDNLHLHVCTSLDLTEYPIRRRAIISSEYHRDNSLLCGRRAPAA